jgi:pyruvate dehydrogenase E2 component (dihydrolipoamide acetyltransferase)
MAVAIDGGLITPTIIKAQEQDLFSISRTWKELVEKAKSKKLSPAEYNSGMKSYYFCFESSPVCQAFKCH